MLHSITAYTACSPGMARGTPVRIDRIHHRGEGLNWGDNRRFLEPTACDTRALWSGVQVDFCLSHTSNKAHSAVKTCRSVLQAIIITMIGFGLTNRIAREKKKVKPLEHPQTMPLKRGTGLNREVLPWCVLISARFVRTQKLVTSSKRGFNLLSTGLAPVCFTPQPSINLNSSGRTTQANSLTGVGVWSLPVKGDLPAKPRSEQWRWAPVTTNRFVTWTTFFFASEECVGRRICIHDGGGTEPEYWAQPERVHFCRKFYALNEWAPWDWPSDMIAVDTFVVCPYFIRNKLQTGMKGLL